MSNRLNEESSGSVVECLTSNRGVQVRASLEALHCVLEQDTLSTAYSTGSTQEDPFLHD